MLRKVGESAWPISEKDAVVSIKDASYPIPFPQGLEFNSPAHGCWNIVHTGMLIPEAHQIYVCADNCMRGVVLTAAEMCEEDRFSFVIVEEQNLLSGNLEDVTIEGTADILRKLKEREEKTGQKMPKAVLLFTVCLHHFLGCDLERIYRELAKWSIRLRRTLNEAAMAASVSFLRIFSTSASELSSVMSLRSGLTKIAASEPPFERRW